MKQREKFSSRLGFILISAGCAIGLGNVWRFPYLVGQNGGAAFILIYLFFLVMLGIPIMTSEFAVGRGSRLSVASSFKALEPPGKKWHLYSYLGMAGNYLLMMFYTVISGWIFAYIVKMLKGDFVGMDATGVQSQFNTMVADPWVQILCLAIVVLLGFGICSLGLKNGVEKITKVMMVLLIVLMVALAIHSVTLKGAGEGLRYYLVPDFSKIAERGVATVLFDAMGQAFFTLSIGMGSMAIIGSYMEKDKRILGEAINITALDTFVAVMAGLIILPACSASGVPMDAGPSLIFVTLPNIFNTIPLGQLWGALFFVFMLFAALSTLVAVFENILSFGMDLWGWSRKKACLINLIAILVLSLPALLGSNVWSGVQILGMSITDFEDFLVSNNILPIGSIVYVLFCVSKRGWGWKNFLQEANTGEGMKFPNIRIYMKYVIPIVVLYIFIQGYIGKFFM
ncbi:MAG: sodium-dependent transporter [Christensenellales bacterium]